MMTRVLQSPRNCDPLVKAQRFALLVDGDAYYGALADCIRRAQRTVISVGWDLDSRMRLRPGGESLGDFLSAAADANPQLNIYILSWDFPILFANVRDPNLVLGQTPFDHPRVHFKFDSTHPTGGSHHQKIVVVDGCLAFAGGMDLAGGRWDTSEHRADDPRREGKDEPYPPTHDIQALVDGEAARALAAIVRDRWHRSTGSSIPDFETNTDLWPDSVKADVEDVFVGISRTDFAIDGAGARYEIEQLHFDLIQAARRFIYIENQYLTSETMASALSSRLEEDDGPEVVIVLPLKNSGWLEENTIEALRFRSMRRLRDADDFGRLRICYPVVPGLDGDTVQVHSKILVVDDQVFRVGSSNLTNRSMRLDTECDLTIEATAAEHRPAISRLRNRLLGEHLGLSADEVEAFLTKESSLIGLVDSRRTEPRCLREFERDAHSTEPLIDDDLIDPSGPITVAALARTVLPAALIVAAVALGLWALSRTTATSPPTKR